MSISFIPNIQQTFITYRLCIYTFINDYLHSCQTIGINEANKSTDVEKEYINLQNVTELSPHFNALWDLKIIFHHL